VYLNVRRGQRRTRIHRADDIELYAVDREFLAALVPHLARRTTFALSVSERHLYPTVGGAHLPTELARRSLTSPAR